MDHRTRADLEAIEHVPGVALTQLVANDDVSLQRLRIDPGATVPEHAHEQAQLGFVFRGTQTIVTPDETVRVEAGESYALEPTESHAVENRGDDPVEGVACFTPPRAAPDWPRQVTSPSTDDPSSTHGPPTTGGPVDGETDDRR